MNRYILIINGTPFILKEDCIKNWDEVSLSLKRNDFSGIIRSFSSKFEFTGKAYNLLLNEYRTNYLKANAQIEVYTTDNERNKRFVYGSYLDFGSLEYDDTTVYINAIDDSLAAKIKAKKSTQYEYLVDELKEKNALSYDRLLMKNTVKWIITGDTVEENGITYIRNTFEDTNGGSAVYGSNYSYPLYINGDPEIVIKNIVEIDDVEKKHYENSSNNFPSLLKNISEEGLRVNININFKLHVVFSNKKNDVYGASLHINTPFGSSTGILKEIVLVEGENNINISLSEVLIYGKSLNGRIVCYIHVSRCTCIVSQILPSASNEFLDIDFAVKGKPAFIDVIAPAILLNRLLKSINEEKEGYIGEIDYSGDTRLSSTMIMAAESARGLEKAKIYTSFKKFSDWMESVYGYVPDITENKVVFKKRTSLFHSEVQKRIGYTGDEFKVKVNSSLIYALLRVGYDKQDYDSINGRDEFHFTNEYDTGITITDKALELISPLRADPYGIEFLVSKRGEDTTDSDSDNDTFFVGASLNEGFGYYELVRDGYSITGIISSSSMFNVMFSPRSIIEANKEYIASFMKSLRFASSSGNSDVVINDVAENSDIELTDPLFTVDTLSISTADGVIPSDVNALVEVERNSLLYTCFINELKYKIGHYEGVDYNLQIKSIG